MAQHSLQGMELLFLYKCKAASNSRVRDFTNANAHGTEDISLGEIGICCSTLFVKRALVKEHEPEIWWKIKNKLSTSMRLKYYGNIHFWTRCMSFLPTSGHEMPFPCMREEIRQPCHFSPL